MRIAAYILTTIVALFLTFDTILKVLQLGPAVKATTELGYTPATVLPIGIVELVCLALYLVPQTSVIGAVLLTGYLGGAVASQVRAGNPMFSHTLFPVYVALMLWGGLYLREPRLADLLPLRK
jgi:hypothetical protein